MNDWNFFPSRDSYKGEALKIIEGVGLIKKKNKVFDLKSLKD